MEYQINLQLSFEIASFLLFLFAVLKFSDCIRKPGDLEVRV